MGFDLGDKILGVGVSRVQNSVGKYGGYCTWQFSQCLNPVSALIGQDKVSKNGICEMLSAKWIDEHAHGGALANWIVNTNGQIDPSKIRMLMQLFILGETMRPSKMIGREIRGDDWDLVGGGQNQDNATRNFLASRGIIRRGNGLQNGWGVGKKSGSAKIKVKLAQDLCDSRGGSGSYRIIGIYEKGNSGHCMACYTGLQDIAFFDPNFGEFWFEDKTRFRNWFTDEFFPKSLYSLMMNHHYELFDYALRAH